jgi:hypothetical protein
LLTRENQLCRKLVDVTLHCSWMMLVRKYTEDEDFWLWILIGFVMKLWWFPRSSKYRGKHHHFMTKPIGIQNLKCFTFHDSTYELALFKENPQNSRCIFSLVNWHSMMVLWNLTFV